MSRPSAPRFLAVLFLTASAGCAHYQVSPTGNPGLAFPGEHRLKNIRQLTHEGINTKAHWSFDGSWLSYQHRNADPGHPQCDRIYRLSVDGHKNEMISDGQGEATSSFFFPDDSRILYSSTAQPAQIAPCPADSPNSPNSQILKSRDAALGPTWFLNDSYQIYDTHTDETDTLPVEPGAPHAYNSETTVCRDGSIVFTSDRNGDPDLYIAKLDPQFGSASGVKQITFLPGYDGNAFFSADCTRLVWSASRPRPGKELEKYKALLAEHRIQPDELEIWTANADGSHAHQLTRLGASSLSFAPSFAPGGKKIIFTSNVHAPHSQKFELYLINLNGTGLERLTYSDTRESFPMFSPDGKYLVFSSDRAKRGPGLTDVMVADWTAELPPPPHSEEAEPVGRFLQTSQTLSAPPVGAEPARAFVKTQMKDLGLEPVQNIADAWSQGCSRGARPVVVMATFDATLDGADIAALIETARMLSSDKAERNRCYLFATAPPEGQFSEILRRANIRPKAILALQRVGRMENNEVTLFGSGSAQEWPKLLGEECDRFRLNCASENEDSESPNLNDKAQHVPSVRFVTGPRLEQGGETNATGGIQVAEMVSAIAHRVSDPQQPITYQKIKVTPAPGKLGGRPVALAYLGVIPDVSASSASKRVRDGVRVLGARPGSPAEQAGIRKGDVLFAISLTDKLGNFIRNAIHDDHSLVTVLGQLQPGQPILLGIRRGERNLDLPATLGKQ
jgi:TolB protein